MDNAADIREIIEIFEKLKAKDPRCGRILCSTCGGYGTAIRENLSIKECQNIHQILSRVSPEEFRSFGVWRIIIEKISPSGVDAVHAREAQSLNMSDIRAVDRFLFDRRCDHKSSPYERDYLAVLDQAIPVALKTSDASLVETLVVILGEQASQYSQLVDIAIKLSENNEEMQRVLYNKLRETVPAVRGYVGYGGSPCGPIDPWY